MKRLSIVVSLLILILLASCSGASSAGVQPDPLEISSVPKIERQSDPHSPQLWGLWQVEWNPEENRFDTAPLRSVMFACNVIKFINAYDTNLIIKVNSMEHEPGWMNADLDIGLRHPFLGFDCYTGFDVMGVFMGQGSEQYPGPEGFAIAGPDDQQLLNPDGYTRRFNASEFSGAGQIMPLQGFFPGNKGTAGYSPTAVLNPYKYYTDGLTPDYDAFFFLTGYGEYRGSFHPGMVNYRNFKVRFPLDLLEFQYAVLANWEPNADYPDPPGSLDEFPTSANSQEAVVISVVDSSDAYYIDESEYGGDVVLDITPWDWSASCSASMEEYSIKLYSSAWTGPFMVDMTPTASAEYHYTFHADIPVETLDSSGSHPVWIEVGYPGYDYASPVGVPNDADGQLAAYFMTSVTVLDYDPTPPPVNYVYGFADSQLIGYVQFADNAKLLSNMLNLPLEGPYAQNTKVMYYEGRSREPAPDHEEIKEFVESLGYSYIVVEAGAFAQLPDTTGVKMLILATYLVDEDYDLFYPEEIQAIRDFLNGGGICIILSENYVCYWPPYDTHILDQLLSELDVDFSDSNDGMIYYGWKYTDFTPDPILEGVSEIRGSASGRFDVFGEGVSLVRGDEVFTGKIFTAICKSPWKG